MVKILKMLLIILVGLTGLLIMFYPTLSNFVNERSFSRVITSYKSEIDDASQEEIAKEWNEAYAYNEGIASGEISDPFGGEAEGVVMDDELYNEQLNISKVMGYIEIDKIGVMLPIYHGTSNDVLSVGVGHLQGTSIPVGGESTHAVLTGHRGLPSAVLFTNLDELVIGDEFILHVLDAELVYEVDRIEVIEPFNTELLKVEEGGDYVTLMTCTPYGINSHRMLIRGKHVRTNWIYDDTSYEKDLTSTAAPKSWTPVIVASAMVVVIIIALTVLARKRRKARLIASKNWIDHI